MMKKILLAAAIFAVASINSFGAACADTGALSSYISACTVTNGAFGWTLSNFGIFDAAGHGYNGAVMTGAGLRLTITPAGSTGINLEYTPVDTGVQFFSYAGRDTQWLNGIWITANSEGSNIVGVTLTSSTNAGTAYQSFEKEIQVPRPFSTLDSLNIFGVGAAASGSVSSIAMNANQLSLNDRIVFDAKGGRSGSAKSYTNTFYAAAPQEGGIPEPMTFVLMGAGLVGIAALRRRKV